MTFHTCTLVRSLSSVNLPRGFKIASRRKRFVALLTLLPGMNEQVSFQILCLIEWLSTLCTLNIIAIWQMVGYRFLAFLTLVFSGMGELVILQICSLVERFLALVAFLKVLCNIAVGRHCVQTLQNRSFERSIELYSQNRILVWRVVEMNWRYFMILDKIMSTLSLSRLWHTPLRHILTSWCRNAADDVVDVDDDVVMLITYGRPLITRPRPNSESSCRTTSIWKATNAKTHKYKQTNAEIHKYKQTNPNAQIQIQPQNSHDVKSDSAIITVILFGITIIIITVILFGIIIIIITIIRDFIKLSTSETLKRQPWKYLVLIKSFPKTRDCDINFWGNQLFPKSQGCDKNLFRKSNLWAVT